MDITKTADIAGLYPLPIVEHRKAYKSAQEKIFAIRQTASAIEESKRVFVKHGSRKKRDPLPKPKKASGFRQLSFFDVNISKTAPEARAADSGILTFSLGHALSSGA